MSLRHAAAPRYRLLNGRYRVHSQYKNGTARPFNVFFADDRLTHEPVVIKQANLARWEPLGSLIVQEKEEMLRREASLLSHVQHHRLPSVIETFYDGDQFSLALSFVSGTPLERYVRFRSVPGIQHHQEITVICVGLAISGLLDYLHHLKPPLIHRDIKPGNIIVVGDGTCALIDFGNARHYKPPTRFRRIAPGDTIPGIGTPGYAPPELRMVPCKTTPASDIYSLGVVLYQLITGYSAGEKPVEQQYIYAPLTPYVRAGGICSALSVLIMQMLEWEQVARPGSAHEVVERLKAIARSQGYLR